MGKYTRKDEKMLTKNGRFRIIDITSYLPGKKIPKEFEIDGGFFYFQPAHWNETDFGNAVANRNGFPLQYSRGFQTAEECLEEANKWELEEIDRDENFIWKRGVK